jgi:hypothetical protein
MTARRAKHGMPLVRGQIPGTFDPSWSNAARKTLLEIVIDQSAPAAKTRPTTIFSFVATLAKAEDPGNAGIFACPTTKPLTAKSSDLCVTSYTLWLTVDRHYFLGAKITNMLLPSIFGCPSTCP